MMLLAMPAAIVSERGVAVAGVCWWRWRLGLGFLLVDGILSAFGTSGRISPSQQHSPAPLLFAALRCLAAARLRRAILKEPRLDNIIIVPVRHAGGAQAVHPPAGIASRPTDPNFVPPLEMERLDALQRRQESLFRACRGAVLPGRARWSRRGPHQRAESTAW